MINNDSLGSRACEKLREIKIKRTHEELRRGTLYSSGLIKNEVNRMKNTNNKVKEMSKIEKEALKQAEDYASHMTTVMKRAYFDGFIKGHKQQTLKKFEQKIPTTIPDKPEPKIGSDLLSIKKKITKRPIINPIAIKGNTKQGKILKYLTKHKLGCIHQFMKVTKETDIHKTSSTVKTIVKDGKIVVHKPSKKCKAYPKRHRRYELTTKHNL